MFFPVSKPDLLNFSTSLREFHYIDVYTLHGSHAEQVEDTMHCIFKQSVSSDVRNSWQSTLFICF
jgi:hypothetical protein